MYSNAEDCIDHLLLMAKKHELLNEYKEGLQLKLEITEGRVDKVALKRLKGDIQQITQLSRSFNEVKELFIKVINLTI